MKLNDGESLFKTRLLKIFGSGKSFCLRKKKIANQWRIILTLRRNRFLVADSDLRDLQRQLDLTFSQGKIIIVGEHHEVDHTCFRLLSRGEIVSVPAKNNLRPKPCRRNSRITSSIAFAH